MRGTRWPSAPTPISIDPPEHPDFAGWTPVAERGDISPHSRTSLLFGTREWPIKPDICMEGGNLLADGTGRVRSASAAVRADDRRPRRPCVDLRVRHERGYRPGGPPWRACPGPVPGVLAGDRPRADRPRRRVDLDDARADRGRARQDGPTANAAPLRLGCTIRGHRAQLVAHGRHHDHARTASRRSPVTTSSCAISASISSRGPSEVLAELGASPVTMRVTLVVLHRADCLAPRLATPLRLRLARPAL